MASHYAVESCKETLAKSGLSPEAESSICEQAMMLPSVHRICASQPKIGMPYQLIICYNKSTGEQKWWPDNIFENCAKLNKADPNWELEAAFCCCYVLTPPPNRRSRAGR